MKAFCVINSDLYRSQWQYSSLYFPGHIHNLIAKNKRKHTFSNSVSPPSVKSAYDTEYISDLSFLLPLKNILLSVKSSPRDKFMVKLMKPKFQRPSLALTPSETLQGVSAVCSHGYVFLQNKHFNHNRLSPLSTSTSTPTLLDFPFVLGGSGCTMGILGIWLRGDWVGDV